MTLAKLPDGTQAMLTGGLNFENNMDDEYIVKFSSNPFDWGHIAFWDADMGQQRMKLLDDERRRQEYRERNM